jgi:SAM-dependent methyltransferase
MNALVGKFMEPVTGVSFSPARLRVIANAGERHFWHEPRLDLIVQLLETHRAKDAGPLLDVGCGTGSLVRTLLARGYEARGVDPFARESGLCEPAFIAGTLAHLPWDDASFATVCAFDVLEHVDEDAALVEMMRVLRPGGLMLVSVPAYQALWGPRDDAAGHLRRYSRRMLGASLSRHGLKIERLFGFQLALLPAMLVSRWIARWRRREEPREDNPGVIVNAFLRSINAAEVSFGRVLRPPIGTSLFAVARKGGAARA